MLLMFARVCAGVLQCVGGKDPSLPQSKRDSSYILLISAALQAQTFFRVTQLWRNFEKVGQVDVCIKQTVGLEQLESQSSLHTCTHRLPHT